MTPKVDPLPPPDEQTFSVLADLIDELVEELDLGKTPRLRPLVLRVKTLATALDPIERQEKHVAKDGTEITETHYRSGGRARRTRSPNGRDAIEYSGPLEPETLDREVSDLHTIRTLCLDWLVGSLDPQLRSKLSKLARRVKKYGQGPESMSAAATPPAVTDVPDLDVATGSRSVILCGQGKAPLVRGKQKPRLNTARYGLVRMLIKAGAEGMTKDQLECKYTSARRMLREMRDDPDWAAVIQMAEQTGGGYRVI